MRHGKRYRVSCSLASQWPRVLRDSGIQLRLGRNASSHATPSGSAHDGPARVAILSTRLSASANGRPAASAIHYLDVLYQNRTRDEVLCRRVERALLSAGAVVEPPFYPFCPDRKDGERKT